MREPSRQTRADSAGKQDSPPGRSSRFTALRSLSITVSRVFSFLSPSASCDRASLAGRIVISVANPTCVRWRPCFLRICSVW